MITLATLPDATAQQVFDQVVTHLLTQNTKSVQTGTNLCCYRNGELKCAAGCFISEEEYKPEMEGFTWFNLVASEQVPQAHHGLISKLQTVHDKWPTGWWSERLKIVAEHYQLNFNPPQQ